MEVAFFFDAVLNGGVYDRAYNANDFSNYFAELVGNGVIYSSSSVLQVVPSSGMVLNIQPGKAFIVGRKYENTTPLPVTIETANGSLSRLDRVCIKLDKIARTVEVIVKTGVPAASPVAPELIRTNDVFEISLARVLVGASVSAITAANITDERLNKDVCGIVTGLIEQIDASTMFDQLQNQFNVWFQSIRDQLSEDAAGNLQLQINTLNGIVGHEGVTAGSPPNYTLTLDNFALVEGVQVKVKMHQSTSSSATLNINGLGPKPVVDGYGENVQNIAAGAWVILVYDGTAFQTIGLSTQFAKYS